MRKINIEHLKEGMITAKPIYTATGIVLLSEGSSLTGKYIEKIEKLNLPYIYIKDELSAGITVDAMIPEEMKQEVNKTLHQTMDKLKSGFIMASSVILKKIEEIVNEVTSNPRVMLHIQDMRSRDEYLYLHSINVCIISLLIGKHMNYTEVQMKHLALGAILHDAGKVKLGFDFTKRYKDDYVEKEWEMYAEHPLVVYKIVQNIPGASETAAQIVKMHHERMDGTGFPGRLKGNSISELARIVAIADEYDNLVYNLPKEKAMKHHEIVEYIIARAYSEFDADIILHFRDAVSPYPISTGVMLSDKRIGIVSKINVGFPSRSVVRIINPDRFKAEEEIDLSKQLAITIIDEIEVDKFQ